MSTKIIIYRAIGIAILTFVAIKVAFPILKGVISLLSPIIAMCIILFLLSAIAFAIKNSATYSKKLKAFISDLIDETKEPVRKPTPTPTNTSPKKTYEDYKNEINKICSSCDIRFWHHEFNDWCQKYQRDMWGLSENEKMNREFMLEKLEAYFYELYQKEKTLERERELELKREQLEREELEREELEREQREREEQQDYDDLDDLDDYDDDFLDDEYDE